MSRTEHVFYAMWFLYHKYQWRSDPEADCCMSIADAAWTYLGGGTPRFSTWAA
jgi:hypothetical protein